MHIYLQRNQQQHLPPLPVSLLLFSSIFLSTIVHFSSFISTCFYVLSIFSILLDKTAQDVSRSSLFTPAHQEKPRYVIFYTKFFYSFSLDGVKYKRWRLDYFLLWCTSSGTIFDLLDPRSIFTPEVLPVRWSTTGTFIMSILKIPLKLAEDQNYNSSLCCTIIKARNKWNLPKMLPG